MPWIIKTHSILDESRNEWFEIFKFRRLDGEIGEVEVLRSASGPAELRRALLAAGATLPESSMWRSDLVDAVARRAPVLRRVASNGWRLDDSGSHYVSFRHVATASNSTALLPPSAALTGTSGNVRSNGSLEEWRRLAAIAVRSTTMMVMLCAPFAAPLLSLLNRPNFGLVFFGPSRTGKSTGQLLAASALGFRREEDLPTLNATGAGLLAAGLLFNDHMLPINEVGAAGRSKEDVARAVRDAAYSLMSGQDVLRHPSWHGNNSGSNAFKIIAMLSSEFSPDQWAERTGGSRDPGETARLIGVPALFDGGSSIIDCFPEGLSHASQDDFVQRQFGAIRNGVTLHHGVAYRAFIMRLIREIEESVNEANWMIRRFEEELVSRSMTPIERDIVAKFGVLLAGGCRAIGYGILPFGRRPLALALARACRGALAALPDPEAELKRDLARIRDFLRGLSRLHDRVEFKPGRSLIDDADGYVVEVGPSHVFTVRARALSELLREPVRLRRALEWLDNEGLLVHQRTRTASGRSIGWAETQPTWPNGARPRSIVFKLPRGLREFDRNSAR